jgi:hypothetical protein
MSSKGSEFPVVVPRIFVACLCLLVFFLVGLENILFTSGVIVVLVLMRLDAENPESLDENSDRPNSDGYEDWGGYEYRSPETPMSSNWPYVLGVERDTTFQNVKKAHRQKALKYHPDRLRNASPDASDYAHKKMCAINQAWSDAQEESTR